MLSFFKQLSLSRGAWLLFTFSCISLEGVALYFQHGMGLQPCVMCIYERLALLVILIAGFIGFIVPSFKWLRWFALSLGVAGSVKGLMLAIKHTDYQLHPAPWNTCSPFLDFPSALPLDEWFPRLFAAGGDCSKISWEFLGLVMPQWLIIVFSIYLVILSLLIISQFKAAGKPQRSYFYR